MTDYRYTAETMPAVGDTIITTAYYADGGTEQVSGRVTDAGTSAGWFLAEGRNVEHRFEHQPAPAPAPLYTYSDGHTGEFDNYAHQPDGNPDTLVLYAYHADERDSGSTARYVREFSAVLRRTNRTVEGDRAEDPDAWETTTDTYSPGHDVNPGTTGDEVAIDGVVWSVDFDTLVPFLPAGWPDVRPLVPAPARPGWQGSVRPATVTLPYTLAEVVHDVLSQYVSTYGDDDTTVPEYPTDAAALKALGDALNR